MRFLLKILVTLLNLLIIYVILSGEVSLWGQDWAQVVLFIAPIFNLIYIHGGFRNNTGWLSLYVIRKKLEEQKKIDTLNDI